MKITKNNNFTQITGEDNNGEFRVSIQNDCSQVRIETLDDNVYFDVNYRELKAIRDCISGVLDGFDNNVK